MVRRMTSATCSALVVFLRPRQARSRSKPAWPSSAKRPRHRAAFCRLIASRCPIAVSLKPFSASNTTRHRSANRTSVRRARTTFSSRSRCSSERSMMRAFLMSEATPESIRACKSFVTLFHAHYTSATPVPVFPRRPSWRFIPIFPLHAASRCCPLPDAFPPRKICARLLAKSCSIKSHRDVGPAPATT